MTLANVDDDVKVLNTYINKTRKYPFMRRLKVMNRTKKLHLLIIKKAQFKRLRLVFNRITQTFNSMNYKMKSVAAF